MLDAYFAHMGHNDPSKCSVSRSHVGPVLVGMALVGGVATYAYRHASPQPVDATPSSTSAVLAASPRFDLTPTTLEKARGSVTASAMVDGNQQVRPGLDATPPAILSTTSALAEPRQPVLSWARRKASDHMTHRVLTDAAISAPAHADVLELGPSYEAVDYHETLSAPAPLAQDPSLVAMPSNENAGPAQQTEVGLISSEQLPSTNIAAIEDIAHAEPSAGGDRGSTSAGPQTAPDELVEETATVIDDASINRPGEHTGVVAVTDSVDEETRIMPAPGGASGKIALQVAPILVGSAVAPPPQAAAAAPNANALTGYTQFYIPTFLNGREIGSIPLRIAPDKAVSVHLGSFLSLFHSSMDVQLFERLRLSANAQKYVSLASMKTAGFNLYYDILNKRLILGIN